MRPSDFDQTHILTINYSYDVPSVSKKRNMFVRGLNNWQISAPLRTRRAPKNNISVTYTSGTATITAGQTCPPGSIQTSATVCTMITDFTGGQVNARANDRLRSDEER